MKIRSLTGAGALSIADADGNSLSFEAGEDGLFDVPHDVAAHLLQFGTHWSADLDAQEEPLPPAPEILEPFRAPDPELAALAATAAPVPPGGGGEAASGTVEVSAGPAPVAAAPAATEAGQ